MKTVTLYHGTSHDFEAFALSVNPDGEMNSALGIHLTEKPELAAMYAERSGKDDGAGRSRVLIVEADVGRVALVDDQCSFYGRDIDGELDLGLTRWDFAAARERLMAEGFCALATDIADDDLTGAWVVLDPSRLRIVGELSVDEAMDMEEPDSPDVRYERIELFEGLIDRIHEMATSHQRP